jgi:two-component system, NarL family, response regulator DesR
LAWIEDEADREPAHRARVPDPKVEGDVSGELRVLIVEDRWLLADAFRLLLEDEPDIALLPSVQGLDAVEICRSARPDVALVDIDLRSADGLTLARQVREASASTKVMVMSELPDRKLERRATEAGASLVVSTRRAAGQLPQLVRQVAGAVPPADPRERGTDLG